MGYLSKVSGSLEGVDEGEPSETNVLVVDDEFLVAELYGDWLLDEGYSVDVATSGLEALREVNEETDVVVLDRRMPRFTGDQVLDVLKSGDIYDMVPERFEGDDPYRTADEEEWDKDIGIATTKALNEEIVEKVQSKEIDCQVCMVTAVDPEFDVIDMRFDYYLTKTVEKEELLEAVEGLASVAKLGEDEQEYQSLYSKKSLLEGMGGEVEVTDDDRYRKLQEDISEMEEDSDIADKIKKADGQ